MTDVVCFDITDGVRERLDMACRIAFRDQETAALHWRIDKVPASEDWHTPVENAQVERITLFWAPDQNSYPLPAPISCDGAASMLSAFLDNTAYGPEPDHEGFNRKGWRIFNDARGEGGTRSNTILALEPRWMLYGK